MPSIFLSHNSADKPFARKLAARLIESGVTVWLDEVHMRIGESLVDKISSAIDQVEFVAAILSPRSLNSSWVKKELSLAMAKEIESGSVVVLPLVIGDCDIPAALRDKLYADFRKAKDFERQSRRLLASMGVGVNRTPLKGGISVDWTGDGPRILGRKTVISGTEGAALLDRYFEWFPRFIEQEKERRGEKDENIWGAANVSAVMRAGLETYNRVPDEPDMKELKTELARKFDLFFAFIHALHYEEFLRRKMTGRPAKRRKRAAAG